MHMYRYRSSGFAIHIEMTCPPFLPVLKAAAVGNTVTMSRAGVNVGDGIKVFDPIARNIARYIVVRSLASRSGQP